MIVLVPMRPPQFEQFAHETTADYARDNVSALRWSADHALERARAEFARLLPQGPATPGHFLCAIQRETGGETDGETLGWLWYAVHDAGGARWLYLYNIRVLPSHRGQGHARAALERLQHRAAELGAEAIELHVFAVNPTAHALYRSLGYGITGYNMIKRLGPAAA
ncbi:MAG: GNAT family N-acetyltransferase [Rubrivivax sp.]